MKLLVRWCVLATLATSTAACAVGDAGDQNATSVPTTTVPTTTVPATAAPTTRAATTTTVVTPSSTSPAATSPAATAPSTTAPPPAVTVPVVPPDSTPYALPSPDPGAGWGTTHAGYPATDIFVPSGCGGQVVAPVNGALLEVRRIDSWSRAEDNPATRGGKSVSILGDDGVRYYLAHFAEIVPGLEPGSRVLAGEQLGEVGSTGRSSACHIHFGISPPCPRPEWSVRRGAVWPSPYLDAWRAGDQRSPVDEIRVWVAANPNACDDAALDIDAAEG